MQKTTHTSTHKSAGPLADAGPYDYDLPVVRTVSQPAPAPAPTSKWKQTGLGWKGFAAIFFVTMGAQALRDWMGWTLLDCYALLYCIAAVFMYWDLPKPRQGFLSWTLRMVGIFLNLYVALVTVPRSLRGLLPDSLAFSLPAFAIFLIFYWVPPLLPLNRTTPPLWKWLLWAAAFAATWGWFGPGTVK